MSKIERFVPPWIRAATPYNDEHLDLARDHAGIDRMMANECPLAPSPAVVQAVAEALVQANLYPDSGRALRAALASRHGLTAANVLLGSGSSEVIDMVLRTFVTAGDEVVISVPTFSLYEARARLAGAEVRLIDLDARLHFDLDALHAALGERTKLLILCTPNNPTGSTLLPRELAALLARGYPTLVDEAYGEFEPGAWSAAALLDGAVNLLVARTFSKAYGIAGLRLGYLLGGDEILGYVRRLRLPWNVGTLALAAGLAALDDVEALAERVAAASEGKAFLARELQGVRGFKPLPPAGNFIVVDASATGLDALAIVAAMLDEGILLRALSPHHMGGSFIRVTVGTPEQNARSLAAFKKVFGEAV